MSTPEGAGAFTRYPLMADITGVLGASGFDLGGFHPLVSFTFLVISSIRRRGRPHAKFKWLPWPLFLSKIRRHPVLGMYLIFEARPFLHVWRQNFIILCEVTGHLFIFSLFYIILFILLFTLFRRNLSCISFLIHHI